MNSCINCKYCNIDKIIYSQKKEGFVKFKCKNKNTYMSETPWIDTNIDESICCDNYEENVLKNE